MPRWVKKLNPTTQRFLDMDELERFLKLADSNEIDRPAHAFNCPCFWLAFPIRISISVFLCRRVRILAV